MPTYEYRCTQCSERLEAVQSFTDDALKDCPSCGQPALRKLFGNVGVVFKGSGFYRNDSREEHQKRSTEGQDSKPSSKEPDSGADSTKSDSGSDSKSADKAKTGPAESKSTGSKPSGSESTKKSSRGKASA